MKNVFKTAAALLLAAAACLIGNMDSFAADTVYSAPNSAYVQQ